ncbi:hypothetical protein FBZ94_103637 [Bradyrhizobium sacchari]|uniref:Uncharacterized protein n=1 Tax=Bradyrhizobium sacchari TaxID=1399419 RepID=A0A560JYG1_9BRAD|nr:hypothetical protein FBZ94_103637 [Bradyrhizobium sacchari]TWB76133.1 hypothetical protein FBZ95_104313 [Bradyrhizobium sacchari]
MRCINVQEIAGCLRFAVDPSPSTASPEPQLALETINFERCCRCDAWIRGARSHQNGIAIELSLELNLLCCRHSSIQIGEEAKCKDSHCDNNCSEGAHNPTRFLKNSA